MARGQSPPHSPFQKPDGRLDLAVGSGSDATAAPEDARRFRDYSQMLERGGIQFQRYVLEVRECANDAQTDTTFAAAMGRSDVSESHRRSRREGLPSRLRPARSLAAGLRSRFTQRRL